MSNRSVIFTEKYCSFSGGVLTLHTVNMIPLRRFPLYSLLSWQMFSNEWLKDGRRRWIQTVISSQP